MAKKAVLGPQAAAHARNAKANKAKAKRVQKEHFAHRAELAKADAEAE